jgi:2-keto-4-pentenoate hydratase/2-oxohepta-3-ene-1,7-dioic acid hydratase in catechol pathway
MVDDEVAREWSSDGRSPLSALLAGEDLVPSNGTRAWPRGQVQLLAPIDPTAAVFCVGFNYLDHQEEASDLMGAVPAHPVIFSKAYRSICGPDDDLVLPADVSTEFDWEVELAVVIGRDGYAISSSRAAEHVAGYTVLNDITARDLQSRHSQWFLGKNVLGSTPVGPWITPRDACGFPPALHLELSVNGVTMQSGSTADMVFGVPELVEVISRVTQLRVGDVIATGTPSGVGFKRNPPVFLVDGDTVEASIEAIGRISNRVRTSAVVGLEAVPHGR